MKVCIIGPRIQYEIRGVCTEAGRCVALDFLRNVEPCHVAAAARLLYRMERRCSERGPTQGGPNKTRRMNGFWEWKEGSLRILWFEESPGGDAIALHGFVKPRSVRRAQLEEIERAERAIEEYRQHQLMDEIELIEEVRDDGEAP